MGGTILITNDVMHLPPEQRTDSSSLLPNYPVPDTHLSKILQRSFPPFRPPCPFDHIPLVILVAPVHRCGENIVSPPSTFPSPPQNPGMTRRGQTPPPGDDWASLPKSEWVVLVNAFGRRRCCGRVDWRRLSHYHCYWCRAAASAAAAAATS